ncbi:MAG: aa3-type cytochrome oxidase subunit II [Marmoricola sp.]
MSLELPKRLRRVAFGGVGVGALLLLSGCSKADQDTWKRIAMPAPRTVKGHDILHLWQNAWIVAMITGVIVWGLIFYACIRFRRRSEDEIPVQTRYNLPIEVFYTLAPVMMVVVFFFFTVKTQDNVDRDFKNPDLTVTVVGQQWSWTFNYNLTTNPKYDQSLGDASQGNTTKEFIEAPGTLGNGTVVHDIGTTADRPTLWLPVGKKVEFHLYSPDVIHSFWSTDFLFKKDVVPGRDNTFGLTPNVIGTFEGRCAELCGVYHSRMLFNVKVVSVADFEQHIKELSQNPATTGPALGSSQDQVQPGLENTGGNQ